jgi:hydrogenase nickel incorporation protein HypA/HybF
LHELAVTESILRIAEEHAHRAGAKRVTHLYLVIGRLSSIVDDSVQFYWDTLSQGSLCEGAQLHFERPPARLTCQDCGITYPIEGDLTSCPNCGSSRVRVIGGDEFCLDSIEIET